MATVMTAREHTLDKGKVHHQWDKSIPPAIEMESIAVEGSGYVDRYNKSEERFAREAGSWLSIRHGQGPSEILAAFRALLSGAQSPSTGVILHP